MAAGTTYEPIATTTLASDSASITFSSISGSYTDLRLVFIGNTGGGSLRLNFNGDTGTNYSRTILSGPGPFADSARETGVSYIQYNYYANTSTSNAIPFFAIADLFSYAGSTHKTALLNVNMDTNGTGGAESAVVTGMWRSTSAITSIALTSNSGNVLAGSTATLYGITKA